MTTLSDREIVRSRPGMYIGDTRDGSGLVHMIWELLANSLDEHFVGRCKRISVEIREDGAIVVDDDGGGMPLHDVGGMSFAERALTSLHTTPTLDGHKPHEHMGLLGVGLCAVNALSAWLELDVFREGRHHAQRFEQGIPSTTLRDICRANRSGTRIAFAHDPAIFPSTWVNPGVVAGRLRELSWLLPALTLEFADLRKHRFHEPNGLMAFLERSSRGPAETFRIDASVGTILVEAAARWERHSWSSIESFANIERTTEGGTHVRGLLSGLARGLRKAAPDACKGKSLNALSRVISEGLNAIVCVRLDDPEYEGPSGSKLVTPAAELAVRGSVEKGFTSFLGTNPALLERWVSKLSG